MFGSGLLHAILQDSTARTPGFPDLLDWLWSMVPAVLTLLLMIAVLAALHRWLHRDSAAPGHGVRKQLIMLGVTALGMVMVILMLPISDDLRIKILGLIGIVLSSGIALSSATFLGNMLAGLMLRTVRNFKVGDFISGAYPNAACSTSRFRRKSAISQCCPTCTWCGIR